MERGAKLTVIAMWAFVIAAISYFVALGITCVANGNGVGWAIIAIGCPLVALGVCKIWATVAQAPPIEGYKCTGGLVTAYDMSDADCLFVPIEFGNYNSINDEHKQMSCYHDHFEVNGEAITDEQAVAFIKEMAGELSAEYKGVKHG